MQEISITDAKAELDSIVEKANAGEKFIITKYGKPIVKITPLDTADSKPVQRLGFLKD